MDQYIDPKNPLSQGQEHSRKSLCRNLTHSEDEEDVFYQEQHSTHPTADMMIDSFDTILPPPEQISPTVAQDRIHR